MDSRLRGNDGRKKQANETNTKQRNAAMNHHSADLAEQQRRAVRRTVWITGAFAFTVLVLFVLHQGFWH